MDWKDETEMAKSKDSSVRDYVGFIILPRSFIDDCSYV